MDLLPKTRQEFSSAEYWNTFFKKRGKESFEWYGEYNELSGILHKYIKTKDQTLVIGCGSSRLSEDLYDLGYHSLVNIDISDIVIKQMKARSEGKRPQLIYEKMDVFKMAYEDNQYSVVLDKGTLDALLPDGGDKNVKDISRMFHEISRVLRIGGRYICVSLAQKHIIDTALQYFVERGWMSRVHCLLRTSGGQDVFPLPVFVFIFTKFKQIPGASPILEFSVGEDGKAERYSKIEALSNMIEQSQNYSLIRDNLQKKLHLDDQIQLDLHSPGSSALRYRLTVVDRKRNKDKQKKFAIFIVPHGREVEWMFATSEGRLQLSDSAGFQRLVVVTLHRGQSYGSLGTIQEELSGKVMDLAPQDLDPSVKVPFLSAGTDIGSRQVRFEGESPGYGKLVVEEVMPEDETHYRRLICLSQENFIQSEVKLLKETSKGNKKKSKSKGSRNPLEDYSHLSLDHQNEVLAGLMMVEDIATKISSGLRLLFIGLASCSLPVFLHKYSQKIHIDVVEPDIVMETVAKEWFGFKEDEQQRLHRSDRCQYVKGAAERLDGIKYDAVILTLTADRQSGSPSDQDLLIKLKEIMASSGVLIISHFYQESERASRILSNVQDNFGLVSIAKKDKTLGTAIYCLCVLPSSHRDNKSSILDKWRTNADSLRKQSSKVGNSTILDLREQLDELKIL